MSYFQTNYTRVNYPIGTSGSRGLRTAQLGAIHAINSHFTLNESEPAVVVMPTGSGKTGVLVLASFTLRANRVLVISSSVLVRSQIVYEFKTLDTLKKSNVFHRELECPKVLELKSSINSVSNWEDMRGFDVVVGIPNSLVTGIKDDLVPPEDLFDLILVDEAHHIPAASWEKAVSSFEPSKKVFFTATPFRRDRKEIEGKIAFNYPLKKAFEDKIFGEVGYVSVSEYKNGQEDLAIAKKTEEIFLEDRNSNLDHYLLVRTDSKSHADELEKLYEEETSLKLRKIHSRLSYGTINKVIEALKDKKLDGVICVNMLGEGFDFPNLKIAAVHSPQKSLAATLQFIGRFARTNTDRIGSAKFISLEQDLRFRRHQLYKEGSVWSEILIDLSEQRIEQEDNTKEVLDSFIDEEKTSMEPISLYNLVPYCHVKIYQVEGYDVHSEIYIRNHEIVNHYVSEEECTSVFITKELIKPKWINSDELVNIQYHIFLFYYDQKTKLLFIHSSIKTPFFYDSLVESFCDGYLRIPKEKIHKVLLNLNNTRIFNLGLQKRSAGGESYLTKAGSDTGNTVTASDGRLYSNGHIFGTAESNGEAITIGYSSGSKVWSNAYSQIPIYIEWCKLLGSKIQSNAIVKTNSGFDNIPVPTTVENLKPDILPYFIEWSIEVYSEETIIQLRQDDEIIFSDFLYEVDLKTVEGSNQQAILFDILIEEEELKIPLKFDFDNGYDYRNILEYNIEVSIAGGEFVDLLTFIDEYPLKFHLTDFSTLINHNELLEYPSQENIFFDSNRILSFDWANRNIDPTKEFGVSKDPGLVSIHDGLQAYLTNVQSDIIIYDHGTGEAADFIVLADEPSQVKIELYHIKGSGGQEPGERVNDVYEVCGQASKSLIWTRSRNAFKSKVHIRTRNNSEKFLRGSLQEFDSIIDKQKPVKFSIIVVQPGLSSNTLSQKVSTILAATDDFIRTSGNNESLGIIGS